MARIEDLPEYDGREFVLARSRSSAALSAMVRRVETKNSRSWMRERERTALAVFKEVAARVPAYKDFLKKHGVRAGRIQSFADLASVPRTSKAEYLREYPLADLCYNGTLARPAVFSSTSGSTGKPFYFPRAANLEEEYSVLIELFLRNGAHPPSAKHPTLVVIGFGMGVWIGGMLTYRAFDIASRRGYPLSILPIGVNKDEILKALVDLAPSFAQTIIVGYPPFVKDIVDSAIAEGIDLAKLDIRLLFAAEAFNERFREYLAEKASIANLYRDTLNIYGTADIGAMAFETPTAILVRRLAAQRPDLFTALFGGTKKMPTLAQYNPAFMCFEAPEGEILLTGRSVVPLVRYAVGDRGGVRSFAEMRELLAEAGVDIAAEAKRAQIPLYELPFVYVYERSDLSTKLYGAIIYPEHVREALQAPDLERFVSGKFTMQTLMNETHDEYIELNVELKAGVEVESRVAVAVRDAVVASLDEKNSEYHYLHASMPERVIPKVVLWPHEDPTYFKPGIKQKWVLKPPAS